MSTGKRRSNKTIIVFLAFVILVVGLSFYLGRKARTSSGYYAAGGQIHWSVNGIAFAGDYLSAASFLGICGMIATVGYDGFLYSIGYLAGWIVALFVVAWPLKRLGKYTFADAIDSKYNSRGIKLAAAISTLVVSICYLIHQSQVKDCMNLSRASSTGAEGLGLGVRLRLSTPRLTALSARKITASVAWPCVKA